MTRYYQVGLHEVVTSGGLARVARLRNEHHEFVRDPAGFVDDLKASKVVSANLFTFVQPVREVLPRYPYYLEWDSLAVLRMSTYDHWWKKQINDKTRNMVRKAQKSGIDVRIVDFSDTLVSGIVQIQNEVPIRQGRRFRHFGKSFEKTKEDHMTFLDRSEFLAAYYKNELIGFIKLVHGDGFSHIMQILSMACHRNKAPTNALVAVAVERCTARRVPILIYGSWSRRSMGDFKKHNAFERLNIPRYYVPLNRVGSSLLRVGLHRFAVEKLPGPLLDQLAIWRGKWNSFRFRNFNTKGAVA